LRALALLLFAMFSLACLFPSPSPPFYSMRFLETPFPLLDEQFTSATQRPSSVSVHASSSIGNLPTYFFRLPSNNLRGTIRFSCTFYHLFSPRGAGRDVFFSSFRYILWLLNPHPPPPFPFPIMLLTAENGPRSSFFFAFFFFSRPGKLPDFFLFFFPRKVPTFGRTPSGGTHLLGFFFKFTPDMHILPPSLPRHGGFVVFFLPEDWFLFSLFPLLSSCRVLRLGRSFFFAFDLLCLPDSEGQDLGSFLLFSDWVFFGFVVRVPFLFSVRSPFRVGF